MDSKINVDAKDLYQMMICSCRYAYTRNNHLTPSSEYKKMLRLLIDMLDVDNDWAYATAKQLCEECISDEICTKFYDGIDDEFGNRKESINFVNDLLNFIHNHFSEDYLPYNYDLFEQNLAKDDLGRYNVYDYDTNEKLNDELLSYNNYIYFILNILDAKSITYHLERLNELKDFVLHILEPKVRNFRVTLVQE